MKADVRLLPSAKVLQELAKLFIIEAHDRHVYCVFGSYARLHPFQKRLQEEVNKGSFNTAPKSRKMLFSDKRLPSC